MQNNKNLFKHESLQDGESIQDILKAISKGFGKGKLMFSDDEGQIEMSPEGLLNLRVNARKEGSSYRLDLKVSWQTQDKKAEQKELKVK